MPNLELAGGLSIIEKQAFVNGIMFAALAINRSCKFKQNHKSNYLFLLF